ncbi:Aminopeptidase N [Dermatophilus congolensis]|uniref:Aminopeptidase N n=1 Tax=Dermatophilus congolensis TaxID=1863 RepID=A0AA46BLR8_9MICO|nr:aminopeptidase N [Dermatophilus congolensis]STD05058.1 Aminopeptidase N [Dermatophilus congolensis]
MTRGNVALTRSEAAHRSTHLYIHNYEVDINLAAAADTTLVTFPVTSRIEFDSTITETFADFIGEDITHLTINGQPRTIEFDGAGIHLRDLNHGRNIVEISGHGIYSRSGEGLHRYVDPSDANTYLYTQFEPADSRRLYPQFDQPDLKASFTFTVTAPATWKILSGSPEANRTTIPAHNNLPELARVTFAPTPRLSTYITCICAGPYVGYHDTWTGLVGPHHDRELTIPLGMFCRASLVDAFDPDVLFTITKSGLDFFHNHFDTPYPWGKYDSIFVPEYNLGAMENPGLVTFTDAGYVFQSGATTNQYEARANTVLHEMAHMWFGDLVTPTWWDDLWLKESFAEYMGALACAEATEHHNAWTAFAARRKAWAYQADQLPTTHPIAADIPDVAAAKQNFDGITYAKGAGVLKQLVAYVGQEHFFAGACSYFASHAFSTATFSDLLEHLEHACGKDLRTWAKLWLETDGLNALIPHVIRKNDTICELIIEQSGQPQRPHQLIVGLYNFDPQGTLRRTHTIDVEVTGQHTRVPEAVGLNPDLVLLNDDDLTYAKVRLDPDSARTVAAHYSDVDTSLARAGLSAAIWNAARDGELPARDFIDIVCRHAPRETDTVLLVDLLDHLQPAIDQYLPATERPTANARVLDLAWNAIHEVTPGSDAQLSWARTFARTAASHDGRAKDIHDLLNHTHTIEGLELTPELRWQLLEALAATGHADSALIDTELAHDTTSAAPVRHLRALASFPDANTKARTWERLMSADPGSNDEVSALTGGFARPGHAHLLPEYTQRYYDNLPTIWNTHTQEIAQRIIRGTFPTWDPYQPGTPIEEHEGVHQAATWLQTHPEAPAALRRPVIESLDHLRRSLRAQRPAN